MAAATDQVMAQKFEANKAGFGLLSKTRQEIAAMVPNDGASQDMSKSVPG